MAKVGLYLKGARGKLAGAVLQKGPKASTIIREKVNPSNPQSDAQLDQRIKLTNAQLFYRQFVGILDHSFEGVKKGNDNRLAFIKENIGQDGPTEPPLRKGEIMPYPLDYLVSKGTLSLNTTNLVNQYGDFHTGATIAETPIIAPANADALTDAYDGNDPAAAKNAMRQILGLPETGIYQLTVLVVSQTENPDDAPNKDRFVYKAYRAIFGEEKEDDSAYLITNGLTASVKNINETKVTIELKWADGYPMTVGAILSSWDEEFQKWRYSTTKMMYVNEAYYDRNIALEAGSNFFENVVYPTWRKAKKGADSTLYLQAGE